MRPTELGFSPPLSAPDAGDPEILLTGRRGDLARIKEPSVRLVIWRDPVLLQLCIDLAAERNDLPEGRYAVYAGGALALRDALGPGFERLGAGLAGLAEAFAAALGEPELDIRLEHVTHDSCRLFHVDFVPARLIATLVGPGTEYLPERAVRRDGLGKGNNRRICRDWAAVRRVPMGAAGLFRGALNVTGIAGAAVHRSPPIAGRGLIRYVAVIEPRRVTSLASACR
jgi:hypothetical protein